MRTLNTRFVELQLVTERSLGIFRPSAADMVATCERRKLFLDVVSRYSWRTCCRAASLPSAHFWGESNYARHIVLLALMDPTARYTTRDIISSNQRSCSNSFWIVRSPSTVSFHSFIFFSFEQSFMTPRIILTCVRIYKTAAVK